MTMQQIRRRLSWRAFCADRGGNVAIIFGLALLPILGFVGAAIDYSRANAARVQLQAAVDSTALMLANEVGTLGSEDKIRDRAAQILTSMYKLPYKTLDPIYDPGKWTLEIKVTATVENTPFYKLFSHALGGNQTEMPIGSSGMVKWGSRLRIALALDTTGSMAQDGKMTALKNAVAGAGGAIDQLSALNLNDGDVYISIITFANFVGGDPANFGATWVDWTEWEAPPVGSMPGSNVGPGSSCPYPNSWNLGYRCTRIPSSGPANVPACSPNDSTDCR